MKKLYRSRRNKVLGGICGGLGNMLGIDPTLARLGVVLLTFFTGFFIIFSIYLISWLIIPLEGEPSKRPIIRQFNRSGNNKVMAGICGAIGERCKVDPVIVRLIAIFLCIITGIVPLVVVYLLAWLIMPLQTKSEKPNMKWFYRSKDDKMIAGVCGGLGEYFNIDPTKIRLGCVIAAIITAIIPFVFVYLCALIMVPKRPYDKNINIEYL